MEGKDETFDIVTMVGSARLESGLFREILEKAFRMLKKGGAMYYQSLDEQETKQEVLEVCRETVQEEAYLLDETYGFHAQYWKLVKR